MLGTVLRSWVVTSVQVMVICIRVMLTETIFLCSYSRGHVLLAGFKTSFMQIALQGM